MTMLAAQLGMTGSARAQTASTPVPTPEGPGSVSGAPNLPAGFADTFASRFIDAGGLRQHAVIGGEGPPLLLVHGWPESWYAWRLLMPALARDFQVIAVDQRGMGLTEKPRDGYDTGTLAGDLISLMDALGHQRFAMVAFDTGMTIAYALAMDHPDRLDRLVIGEAFIPGLFPSPPLFVPEPVNVRQWHLAFNRLGPELNEALVKGREDVFVGAQYAIWAETPLPDEVVNYYVERLASDPDALRGSFGWYRALDTSSAQNEQRKNRLTMPILAIGGETSQGHEVGSRMKLLADDLQTVVIPGTGHWIAEEAPEEVLAALTPFLAPYRDGSAAVHVLMPPDAASELQP